MATEDRSDTKRALVQHATSGERWIVDYCSLWEGDQCVGTRIYTAVGPINSVEMGLPEPLEPSAALFDQIDAAVNLSDEDADWLQAEEDAGRLAYPIGVR